jgi:hypothetical protein
VLLRDHPTVVTSAAKLATGRATAPERFLFQKDRVAQDGAWWEPGQVAMRVAASQEGLPRPRAATQPWCMAQEEELEDTWGMLRQPTMGMRSLPPW